MVLNLVGYLIPHSDNSYSLQTADQGIYSIVPSEFVTPLSFVVKETNSYCSLNVKIPLADLPA